MTGWLPDAAAEWGGLPVARTVAGCSGRCRLSVTGTVVTVTPHPGTAAGPHRPATGAHLDAELDDGTGVVLLRWLGRDALAGVVPGATMAVEGTAAPVAGRLVVLNPLYRFAPADRPYSSTS